MEDLFIAHISGMDTIARGLRNAVKILEVSLRFKFVSPSENQRALLYLLNWLVCGDDWLKGGKSKRVGTEEIFKLGL